MLGELVKDIVEFYLKLMELDRVAGRYFGEEARNSDIFQWVDSGVWRLFLHQVVPKSRTLWCSHGQEAHAFIVHQVREVAKDHH